MLQRDKPLSHLIVILLISMLGANIIGETLRVLLKFFAGEGTVVEQGVLRNYIYSLGPYDVNMVILSFSFALSLHFNFITLMGIFVGWYYFKYSY